MVICQCANGNANGTFLNGILAHWHIGKLNNYSYVE